MRAKEFIIEKRSSTVEDQHPNERPRGPETKPTMPAGTVRVDVSDVYDWYKLGQHISDLEGLGKHDFGKGPPSAIIAFGSEAEEHKYLSNLKKLGLTTTDIDPVDPKQPKGMKRQKVDPTYNVSESKKRKRKSRGAAWGPGPYGGYGYYAGYSGDSEGGDGGGGESINHEASYPGNIGMMELAKFFSMADEEQKTMFKQLLEKGKKGLAWKLVQDIVGVKLQGSEFNEDAMMGKIEDSGKIVRILKKAHTVPFSDEKNWLLIDTDPAKGNKGLGLKWVPASTRFTWVRPYKETMDENFADGRNPQDKGDSKRHGINTKASVSSLRKTAKQGGRKGQLAHWLANMKAGRAKKK